MLFISELRMIIHNHLWVPLNISFTGLKYSLKAIIVHLTAETTKAMFRVEHPSEKHNRKYDGFNGYNGNCIGFNGNYNGVYWYVMESISGMLNPIEKMPKTLQKGIL